MHTCDTEVKHNRKQSKEKHLGSPLNEILSGIMTDHWSHDQVGKILESSQVFFPPSMHQIL